MDREFLSLCHEFIESYNRFKHNAKNSKTDFEKDIVIQRFQFTFSLFLEILKYLLKKYKVNCDYPSACIKKAANFGLIPTEKIYLDMLDDRYNIINLKSTVSEVLYKRIKINYVIALGTFLDKIETNYITKKS